MNEDLQFWFAPSRRPIFEISPEYRDLEMSGLLFEWCGCSEDPPNPGEVSRSDFLTCLHRDLGNPCKLTNGETYFRLPKPLKEYASSEDSCVRRAKDHLRIPMEDRTMIYQFCVSDLELEPGFDYLLMNYLNNIGYMEHGCAIRCGWRKTI